MLYFPFFYIIYLKMQQIVRNSSQKEKDISFSDDCSNSMFESLNNLKNELSLFSENSADVQSTENKRLSRPVQLKKIGHFQKDKNTHKSDENLPFCFPGTDSQAMSNSFEGSFGFQQQSPCFRKKKSFSQKMEHLSCSQLKNCLLTTLNFVDICKQQLKVISQQFNLLLIENKRNIAHFQTITTYYQNTLSKWIEQYQSLKKENIKQSLKICSLQQREKQSAQLELHKKMPVAKEMKKQRKASYNEQLIKDSRVREKIRKSSYTNGIQEDHDFFTPFSNAEEGKKSDTDIIYSVKLNKAKSKGEQTHLSPSNNVFYSHINEKKDNAEGIMGKKKLSDQILAQKKNFPEKSESNRQDSPNVQNQLGDVSEFCKNSKKIHDRLMKLKKDIQQHSRPYGDQPHISGH